MSGWLPGFLHCFPVRSRVVWENLREGVEASGLAVPDEEAIPRRPLGSAAMGNDVVADPSG